MPDDDTTRPEPAGMLGEPTVPDFPSGYRVGVTRYADVILRERLPSAVPRSDRRAYDDSISAEELAARRQVCALQRQ